MTILHTVNRSPFENAALASCLRLAGPGSCILLREDAVVAAVSGSTWAHALAEAASSLTLYVLKADVEARGLSGRTIPEISVVDDAGFVALAAQCRTSIAWS